MRSSGDGSRVTGASDRERVNDVLYTARMILLGALAVIGVIIAMFISARKRSVEVVSLVPPEQDAEGPAVPKRLAASKQAVRMGPPPLPVARETAAATNRVVAPDLTTRKALHADDRNGAIRAYAAQTGLSIEAARNTLDAIMSGKIAVESLVFNAAQNVDAAIQKAIRAGNKLEAIKLYREKTGLGLKEAKDAIDAMSGARAAPPSPAAYVNADEAIDAALRNDQLIQAIKLFREKTGLGLAEAKRAMEARRDQLKR